VLDETAQIWAVLKRGSRNGFIQNDLLRELSQTCPMVDPLEIQRIIATQLSPIAGIMGDATVNEIMVTADGRVWVERSGEIVGTEIVLTEASRDLALTAVAKSVNISIKANSPSAVVSASIGGMRFAGAMKPVESRGTTLCIRKHLEPESRPNLEQLISWEMLTQQQADVLLDLIIQQKKNAVFVGATSSGKTTLTNAILAKVPSYERIGLIEDAQELAPKALNCDRYTTNPEKGIDARLLIKHAMRSRYDRLILGESRGDDTFDLIRALSSGHNGSMTTIHGNSASDGMYTIEMLYQMSIPHGAQIPVDVARKYVAAAINVLVFAERSYQTLEAGVVKSVRKVKEIAIVKSVNKEGNYELEYV
jgi:pilus assembly protein CpaF